MSGVKGGYYPHPDARSARAHPLPPVEPGRVVGLGAICDLSPHRSEQVGSQSFSVGEFATLEDGRRVILHEERGFTLGPVMRARRSGSSGEWVPCGPLGIRRHETLDSLTRDVLNTVLPDDAESSGEDHPWEWLADLARARGLDVTADDLRTLPYEVTFTDEVRRWLAPA